MLGRLFRSLSLSSESSLFFLVLEVRPFLDLSEFWDVSSLIREEFKRPRWSYFPAMNKLGAFPGRAVAGTTVFLLSKLFFLLPFPALEDIDSLESFLLLTSIFKLVLCIRFLFIMVP